LYAKKYNKKQNIILGAKKFFENEVLIQNNNKINREKIYFCHLILITQI